MSLGTVKFKRNYKTGTATVTMLRSERSENWDLLLFC